MKKRAGSSTLTALTASLALAAFSLTAGAATIQTSATVPYTTGTGNFTLIPVAGLDQFDPANGTLTGVTFSLNVGSYSINMSLEGGWSDPGTGAVFSYADLSGQISVNTSYGNGGGLLFSSTVFGGTLFDEFGDVDVTGAGSESEEAMVRLMDAGILGDFIGTGQVSILSFGILSFSHPELVALDDGTYAEGSPQINAFAVGPSDITIDYTYTPTAVPLPAAAWFFMSALGGLVAVKRKQRR